jgi:hypothetical protein
MRALQMSRVILKNFLKLFSKNLQKSLDLFQKCATLFIMKAKKVYTTDELDELASQVSVGMEMRQWAVKMPHFKFPANCTVRFYPPWWGMMVRFAVYNNDKTRECSVYLDTHCFASSMTEPHWEVRMPAGDCVRYLFADHRALNNAINQSLTKVKKVKKTS